MPPGEMHWRLSPKQEGWACAGFETFNTWVIDYNFPSGKLPNGSKYSGTGRSAFIPDTPEGKKIVALLVKAFERRLTFIVGTSVTTGKKDTVVWSGIHHKTNTHGGSSCFGYPDPTYFNRVTLELADRGVSLESAEEVDRILQEKEGKRVVKGW